MWPIRTASIRKRVSSKGRSIFLTKFLICRLVKKLTDACRQVLKLIFLNQYYFLIIMQATA